MTATIALPIFNILRLPVAGSRSAVTAMLLSLLLVHGSFCLASNPGAEKNTMPPHDAAVQQLENLGAKLKWDASNQVILVDLSSCITANAGLDHVQYLPHVATLVLPALVDDSGLRSIGKLAVPVAQLLTQGW